MHKIIAALCFDLMIWATTFTNAQNNRISTIENIGWYNTFLTLKLSPKWAAYSEYQFRRAQFISIWQQSLLRIGMQYQFSANLLGRLGYGWIETFPYGELPINKWGKQFTEHRIFEMIQYNHQENRINLMHRIMLEQRFVGVFADSTLTEESSFPLLHRIRYLFKLEVPIATFKTTGHALYASFYDELFIGFGEHVQANIFDQNRIGCLIGFKWSDSFRFEAGYLNQIVQFGRQIESKSIFQYNHGFAINAIINLDLARKKPKS